MYLRGLYISSEKEKNTTNPGTHHIKYHFFHMTPSCVVSQYALGSLGDPHYFLLRMLLSYDMNQVYFGSGVPKSIPMHYRNNLFQGIRIILYG
jgi:hypothetical protein